MNSSPSPVPACSSATLVALCGNAGQAAAAMFVGQGMRTAAVPADVESIALLVEGEGAELLVLDMAALGPATAALVAALRRRFPVSVLPILLLAEVAARPLRDAALAAGADDFAALPLDDGELLLRARNLLALRFVKEAHQAINATLEEEVRARTAKLDLLIENGLMVSMERDRSKLLRHIIFEGQRLLNCEGGTIYLVTEDKALRFALRTRDDPLPAQTIPLYDPVSGVPNEHYVSTHVALHNVSVLIDDVYRETRFDLSGTRRYDEETGFRTVSMLTVPMAPRNGEVIGVIQFMNARNNDGAIVPFSRDDVPLIEALASQAAVALDNQQLLEAQKALMESMIRVIATAIDAKSPYTGRHCERMPELALMLAKAACDERREPFAEFRFSGSDEWLEFRIGAWLHDCGKVTTPEYVIDKATKLETIHNRIHEIRTRFEVLLRDAEIERLQARLAGIAESEADSRYAARRAELLDDFAFLAECNQGSEMMSAERCERLQRIAGQSWLRHFDDRLGLSAEELARFSAPPATLPVCEKLLADKPEHIIPRDGEQTFDPAYRFTVKVPEHLYNHGEIYNLAVRHGTLTEEERYKINEHMIQGIMMLEQMPFPKTLRRVPEYAGAHHEALNGRGYPRGLSAAQLSIPARILAIADVFEALTAPDRPYKKPNRLSEALRILHGMKQSGHIDPDLFDLFLTSGVYRRYAEQYLNPEQIDAVEIDQFIGPIA